MCAAVAVSLATPLAKQNAWKPLSKTAKRSPDGFGFGGHNRHHSSHGGGRSSGSSSASSGYGAPRQAAPSSDYGAAAAPVCRTEYENECTTVNEEKCETVNDQVHFDLEI